MAASSTLFGLLDLLLVFAAVAGFAVWQLRDLAQEKRRSEQRRASENERAHDSDAPRS